MKKLLIAIILCLFAGKAFSQVQAPDFEDKSQWIYFECGEVFGEIEDENYLLWHEDYRSIDVDKGRLVVVVYKPVKREILENEGEEKFVVVSREYPWLLFNYESHDSNDQVSLFEYKSNSWQFIKSISSDEMEEFLKKEYGLR